MNSFVLRVTTRYLLPLLLLFSVFLFLRGHNEPGGGFVAGLIAAAGFTLYAIAFGAGPARRVLPIDPLGLTGIGLALALLSGLTGVFFGRAFLTGLWFRLPVPMAAPLEVGTSALFDLGVFLTVAGVVLTIIFALEEEV